MANHSKDIQSVNSDTRPPMLDMFDFESWKQRIRLYCKGKYNGENILQSIDKGLFKMGKFRETLTEGALYLGPERDRVFADLTPEEKERYKANIRATNILLQGRQTNTFDDDVDEAPVQDLAINEDHVFQADQYILSEVQDHDNYLDSVDEYQEVHEMHNDVQQNYVVDSYAEYTSDSNIISYDQYVKNNAEQVVQKHVEGIQMDLVKEVKEMKENIKQMEAEVEQNAVDKQCADIERKNLLIENENLIANCLSNELLYSVMNAVNTISRFFEMHDAYTIEQAHCLKLEAEISKLKHKIQKDDHRVCGILPFDTGDESH
nr:integrase, catalytic region, zinc finger, CCHC-type, peptidase aspartic, catalytic [Tanacetum cinerariifolium]